MMAVVDQLSDPKELQRSVRDLVGLSALPALWAGLSSPEICESVGRTLLTMLEAELVFVALPEALDGAAIETVETRRGNDKATLASLRELLRPWIEARAAPGSSLVKNPFGSGELKVIATPIGFRDGAVIVVASTNSSFPSARQQILLGFAADQAASTLQFWQSEAQQHRYQGLVERSPDFIGIAGLDGKVQYVNPAGLAMVGLPTIEDALSHNVIDFLADEDQVRVREELWPVAMSQGRWRGELNFRHFVTSRSMPFSVDWFVLDDGRTGQQSHIATISRDLSAQKGSARDLQPILTSLPLINGKHSHAGADDDVSNPLAQLSPREREVLGGLAAGRPQKLIAHDLGISVRTVEVHRARMLQRLGTRHLAHAIRLSIIAELATSVSASS
jgi:PAS domain S-box-containing protein